MSHREDRDNSMGMSRMVVKDRFITFWNCEGVEVGIEEANNNFIEEVRKE